MNAGILFVVFALLAMSSAFAETDGRFIYVSESKGQVAYVLSDGPGREPDVQTSDMNEIVKEIGRLGHTGSMNYIAIRVRGQIKMSSIQPILNAIEANPTWELAILQRNDDIGSGVFLHHLDNNDPHRKQMLEHEKSEKKSE